MLHIPVIKTAAEEQSALALHRDDNSRTLLRIPAARTRMRSSSAVYDGRDTTVLEYYCRLRRCISHPLGAVFQGRLLGNQEGANTERYVFGKLSARRFQRRPF